MTYDHCTICGSHDYTVLRHNDSCNSTIYHCEDCGYNFEIDDDLFGYDTMWGWESLLPLAKTITRSIISHRNNRKVK